MNEPTISARSVSLPRRSLCQWVDTVTAETSGRDSMKISLRKWKCLRWLELGPPLSWSHVRTEAGVAAVVAGADLGRLEHGEIHMAQAGNVTRPDSLFWLEIQGGKRRKRRGGL